MRYLLYLTFEIRYSTNLIKATTRNYTRDSTPMSFTIYLEIVLQYPTSKQIVIENMADFGQIYLILTSQFPYFHAEHHWPIVL